ncbi:MAG: calcium-binding protein [Microgenomates group bacterium]
MLIEATTQTTEGHVYILDGNDDLNIAAGVIIDSFGTDAVTTWMGQHTVTVSGEIRSHDDGINTIGTVDAHTIIIQVGGKITSGYASALPYIVDSDGVILDGIGSTLVNHGTIISHGSAVHLFVHDGGTTTVTNTGLMSATKYGVWNQYGSGTLNFVNSGTVESPLLSFLGGNWVDNVTNSGLMKGNVDLGNGDDSYVGTGGRVMGQILGGGGNDRFVVGNYADSIDGGDGVDMLDFSAKTSSVTISLGNQASNKSTLLKGDVFVNVEGIIGSIYGDRVTGDDLDNILDGRAGNDKLYGGLGNDTLMGGLGTDTLTGGAGGDHFVFTSAAGPRDYILDFNAAEDILSIAGSAFGYGTYVGALNPLDLAIGTIAKALDATDHFLFRTTDATLWFDADANGAGKAVMIADLNNDAQISAINIWLI